MTAIMVSTPIIIPSRVRNVRSLFAHKEPIAMPMDSPTCILAIFLLLYFTLFNTQDKIKGSKNKEVLWAEK